MEDEANRTRLILVLHKRHFLMFQYSYAILKTTKKFSISLTESYPRAGGQQSESRGFPGIKLGNHQNDLLATLPTAQGVFYDFSCDAVTLLSITFNILQRTNIS